MTESLIVLTFELMGISITGLIPSYYDFTFPVVYSPSSVGIFQHHQRMDFTFHSYSRGCTQYNDFSVELSCWRKSNTNEATLLLGWSHNYKYSTAVITIWLTATKYSYIKWQWNLSFLVDYFFSISPTRLLLHLNL